MPGVPGANGLLQKAADRFVDVTNACFSVGIYLRQTVYPPELSRYLDEDTIVHPNSLYRTADAYLSGRTIWRFKILCSASVPHVPVHDRFRLYPFGQNAAAEMLKLSALNVSEIAEYLGYSNVYYFSRLFKKYYFVSPSKFA